MGCRFDQRVRRFTLGQRTGHKNNRGILAESVLASNSHPLRGRREKLLGVNTARDDADGPVGNRRGSQRSRHACGDRDDHINLSVIQKPAQPARLDRVIHPTRDQAADGQSVEPRTERMSSGRMEMHQVVAFPPDQTTQPPAGQTIQMIPDRKRLNGEIIVLEALSQDTVPRSGNMGDMANSVKIAGQAQHLGLSASPLPFRVNVQDA